MSRNVHALDISVATKDGTAINFTMHSDDDQSRHMDNVANVISKKWAIKLAPDAETGDKVTVSIKSSKASAAFESLEGVKLFRNAKV